MQRTSYTPLSAGMVCQFDVQNDQFVCKNCGVRVPTRLFPQGKPFVVCARASNAPAVPQKKEPRGLGDIVADGLGAVGITKERVQAVAGAAGIRDCGCGKRQAWMNAMGQKYLGIGAKKDVDQK